jgi:pimeloyl-ACP methyl ester carboxylesterase
MNHQYKNHQIFFTDSGSGPALVLLHGYLESSEVWNGFGQSLSEDFRVIAIDLPGHGKSDVYGEVHSMEFMAAAIKDLLERLTTGKIFLVGHSLGGYVAMAFLELFPDMLSGYCLFHSHPFADSAAALEKRKREIEIVKKGKKHLMYPDNIKRMFADSNLEKFPEALQRSKDIASRIPGEGIIAVLNGMMQRPSRLSFMEEGRVPCLWILGAMDNYIPHDAITTGVNLPANAKVVTLKNSGHMGFIEEEDLSFRILRDFEDQVR